MGLTTIDRHPRAPFSSRRTPLISLALIHRQPLLRDLPWHPCVSLISPLLNFRLAHFSQPGVVSPPPAAPKQGGTDMFGDFQNGGAAASSGPTKESIMSLYAQPIAPTAAPPGYRPGMQVRIQ